MITHILLLSNIVAALPVPFHKRAPKAAPEPAIAIVTAQLPDAFVTVGYTGPDAEYSTDWAHAVPFTSTQWPNEAPAPTPQTVRNNAAPAPVPEPASTSALASAPAPAPAPAPTPAEPQAPGETPAVTSAAPPTSPTYSTVVPWTEPAAPTVSTEQGKNINNPPVIVTSTPETAPSTTSEPASPTPAQPSPAPAEPPTTVASAPTAGSRAPQTTSAAPSRSLDFGASQWQYEPPISAAFSEAPEQSSLAPSDNYSAQYDTSSAQAPTTETAPATPTVITSPDPAAPTTTPTPTPAPPAPAPTSEIPEPAPAPSGTLMLQSVPKYIVYSPYNNDNTCKNAEIVRKDLELIKSKGITRLRIYATDCNVLETVYPAAQALGMRTSQGLWIGSGGFGTTDAQLFDLVSWARKNGWSIFDHIILGNEDVENGFITAVQLHDKAVEIKGKLRAMGYQGPFISSETPRTYLEGHAILCADDTFDIIGLNAHSFFAPSFSAGDSGKFVKDQESQIHAVCPNKQILITETGYPSHGRANGNNVPSPENQVLAVNTILSAYGGDVMMLTTYNDFWKDPGPYGVEQYFGLIDVLP